MTRARSCRGAPRDSWQRHADGQLMFGVGAAVAALLEGAETDEEWEILEGAVRSIIEWAAPQAAAAAAVTVACSSLRMLRGTAAGWQPFVTALHGARTSELCCFTRSRASETALTSLRLRFWRQPAPVGFSSSIGLH